MEHQQNIFNQLNQLEPIDYLLEFKYCEELRFCNRMSAIRLYQYQRTQNLPIYVQYVALQNEMKRLRTLLNSMYSPKNGSEKSE